MRLRLTIDSGMFPENIVRESTKLCKALPGVNSGSSPCSMVFHDKSSTVKLLMENILDEGKVPVSPEFLRLRTRKEDNSSNPVKDSIVGWLNIQSSSISFDSDLNFGIREVAIGPVTQQSDSLSSRRECLELELASASATEMLT